MSKNRTISGETKMVETKKTIDASGTIENIEEGQTSRGDTFYKFTIDGQSYTLFDEDDRGLRKGDFVVFNYFETRKENKVYRNLNAIKQEEEVSSNEIVPPAAPKQPSQVMQAQMNDYMAKDADKFELGMAKNNAIILMSKKLEKLDSAQQIEEYIKGAGPEFKKMTIDLFNVGKEIRKEILGY